MLHLRAVRPRTRAGQRTWLRVASLFGLVTLVAVGLPSRVAHASPAREPDVQKYLGTWNYDMPDLATGLNIDVLTCPDGGNGCNSPFPLPLRVPQVGNVVFSAEPDGTVVGVTDQGCHWHFAATPGSLELIGRTQSCFNRAFGGTATITQWTVTVDGVHERESITAISHQPTGDLIATVRYGARTRATGVGSLNSFSRFLGAYTYDPANSQTLVNTVVTDHGSDYPAQGTVWFTSELYGTIVAHTPEGCSWTLAVQGNTAELNPAPQTCALATGTLGLHYWAVATDGEHDDFFLAGTNDQNGQSTNFYLFIGALTRTAPCQEDGHTGQTIRPQPCQSGEG
jgi:hypothetical protein